MIVACDLNGLIGYDGKLLWHNKTDLERFKELTMGGTLIMGHKTYESLPINADGRRLTGRLKHVLSKSWPAKESTDDTKWFRELDRALLESPIDKNHNRNIWIIGGASIYRPAQENPRLKAGDELRNLMIFPAYSLHVLIYTML
jgi:dihydrofolate reductase